MSVMQNVLVAVGSFPRKHDLDILCAFNGRDGRPLVASALGGGGVEVWDPATGEAVGGPLSTDFGAAALCAFDERVGRPLLAVIGSSGEARVIDPLEGEFVGAPLLTGIDSPVTALCGSSR